MTSRSVPDSSAKITGLRPNTRYRATVTSKFGNMQGGTSAPIEFSTPPVIDFPDFIFGKPGYRNIPLVITPIEAEGVSYVIGYRTSTATSFTEVTTTQTEYDITGLMPGTDYVVAIKSTLGSQESMFSPTRTASTLALDTKLETPEKFTTAKRSDESFNVEWDEVVNASMYRVRYRKGTTGSYAELTTAELTLLIPDLETNELYDLGVRAEHATNPAYNSDWATMMVRTRETLPHPYRIAPSAKTATTLDMDWDDLNPIRPETIKYFLRHRIMGMMDYTIMETLPSELDLIDLIPGTIYDISIKSEDVQNERYFSVYSDPLFVQTEGLPAPTGVRLFGVQSSFNVSWQPIPLPDRERVGYRIRYRMAGTSDEYATLYSAGTIQRIGAGASETYEVSVRTEHLTSDAVSEWTVAQTVSTGAPQAGVPVPSNLVVSAPGFVINVSWRRGTGGGAVSSGERFSYDVWVRELGTTAIVGTRRVNYTDGDPLPIRTTISSPGLIGERTYEVLVRERRFSGVSAWATATVRLPASAPGELRDMLFQTGDNDEILIIVSDYSYANRRRVSRQPAFVRYRESGRDAYIVEDRSSVGTSRTIVTERSGESFSVRVLEVDPETQYEFGVKYLGLEWFDLPVNISGRTRLDEPERVDASVISSQGATFICDPIPGAVSYDFEYEGISSSNVRLGPDRAASSTTNSVTVSDFQDIPAIDFGAVGIVVRARANTQYVRSEWSDDVIISFTATKLGVPANLVARGVEDSSAVIAWDSVRGARSYEVRYRISGTTDDYNYRISTSGPVSITGLTQATTYEVSVRALPSATGLRSNLSGDWSDPITFMTIRPRLARPTNLAVGSRTSSTIDLTWDAVLNAGSYVVRYRTFTPTGGSWVERTFTSNSGRLTGLSSRTGYVIEVKAIPSDTNRFSESVYSLGRQGFTLPE